MVEQETRAHMHRMRFAGLDVLAGEVREGDMSKMGDVRSMLIALLVETVMFAKAATLLDAVEKRHLDFDWGTEDDHPGEDPVKHDYTPMSRRRRPR